MAVLSGNEEDWLKAGKIAAEALEYGRKLIKKGASVLDVCDKIDARIIELGAKPAWPSQVSLNNVAAHYTPDHDEKTVFDDQVVCLDVGAEVNGAVGDNALSVDLSGKHSDLIKAAEEALEKAIKIVKAGVKVSEIGKIVHETIEKYGFKPVKNLSGHGISLWTIHDKPSIPNFDNDDDTELVEGQIIAIEPFASTGAGVIQEMNRANIFELANPVAVRSQYAREISKFIVDNYKNLPFTTRWLVKKFGLGKTNLAIKELLAAGALHEHPPLAEVQRGFVTVFEKSMIVRKDKAEIITKI